MILLTVLMFGWASAAYWSFPFMESCTSNPNLGSSENRFSDDLYQIASPDDGARLLLKELVKMVGVVQEVTSKTASKRNQLR